MKTFKDYLLQEEHANETPSVGDVFELEMARDETLIETTVVEVLEDGIVINADDTVMKMFEDAGYLQEYNTGMPAPSGGSKSAMGSVHRKLNTQQSKPDELAEGKMKELLGDINELTHDEFSGKYNMSKDEAREKFDIKDEEELDEMSAMRRLAGMMQDKENIKNTRIPSHDERRIQVDLIDLSDEEFEAKHKMSKAQAREQFDEDMDEMSEPTQDAFEELKDYAETSGGIDKEEFEKAAYLVKAMGKPHLKDKAEGMLDDLIGKMDSDPRDKVIQVLARHIDLTFLKNLFNGRPFINEGKVKEMLLDMEELTDEEFKAEYGMSKAEAKEKFNLDEKYDSDKFFDGKGTPEQRTQLLKLQNKALKAFPSSPKQKEIKKEIDALRKKMGMKVKEEVELDEAEYQGRKVTLNKPTRGDVKKFKVYVKDPKTGNVKKVNFGHGGTSAKKAGQKTMKIKKSNPARRKSFRARHNCDNPGPKTKARYWSCRAW